MILTSAEGRKLAAELCGREARDAHIKFSIIYFPYNNSRYTDIILQSVVHTCTKYLLLLYLATKRAPRGSSEHDVVQRYFYTFIILVCPYRTRHVRVIETSKPAARSPRGGSGTREIRARMRARPIRRARASRYTLRILKSEKYFETSRIPLASWLINSYDLPRPLIHPRDAPSSLCLSLSSCMYSFAYVHAYIYK